MAARGTFGFAAGLVAGAVAGRARPIAEDALPLTLDEARVALGRNAMARAARRQPPQELQPPQMPVLLDGKEVEPWDVAHHPAPVVQYVVSPDTYTEGVLQTFLRPEAAAEYIADVRERFQRERLNAPKFASSGALRDTNGSADAGKSSQPSEIGTTRQALAPGYYGDVGGYVDLFEHVNYQGARWTFWADWGSQNDFRRVFCFLWWCTNMNDRVSSADLYINYLDPAIPYLPYVILFEHINKGGKQLWLWPGAAPDGPGLYNDLGLFGWNDIASSMRYY